MTAIAEQPLVPEPSSARDQLGAAVFQSLNRTYKNRFSVSFVRALLGSILTLGLLPLFGLSRRFRDYISFERQQLSHLADWLRSQHQNPDADALRDFAGVIKFREGLNAAAVLAVMIAGVALVVGAGGLTVHNVWLETFGVRPWRAASVQSLPTAFLVWNVALGAAFVLHWLQIRMYLSDLQHFVYHFNRVTGTRALAPVNPPHLGLGLRVGWIACAVVLLAMGAGWGIPLALAGAAQRRYINHTAHQVRVQMADRVRTILLTSSAQPLDLGYRVHGLRCARPLCRAALPAGATFCPRCGAPVGLARQSA